MIADLFIALFIFTLIFTSFIVLWGRYVIIANTEITFNELEVIAFQATDTLIKTTGYPSDWEEQNITSLTRMGLAQSDRNIAEAKLNALLNASYSDVLNAIGMPDFEFNLQLQWLNQSNITSVYGNVNGTEEVQVRLTRNVLYQNESAQLHFTVWQ